MVKKGVVNERRWIGVGIKNNFFNKFWWEEVEKEVDGGFSDIGIRDMEMWFGVRSRRNRGELNMYIYWWK